MNFYSVKKHTAICLLLTLLSTSVSCSQSDENSDLPIKAPNRIIEFSGYKWIVRDSEEGKQGPGPNYFSNSKDNVWVDEKGRLHLKIVEKNGVFYCSGVTLRQSYGFNKYVFYVGSRVDQLDQNVVGGLFTYKNDDEEIDIEFSKWSNPENENSQYAIQPAYVSGNKERFELELNTKLSTHFFNWQQKMIEFGSYRGHTLNPNNADVIRRWTYTGNNIPPDRDEKLKINLWLFRGAAPIDGGLTEMIIDRVEIY